MRFKTDENVPGLIVSMLRADGHDVRSVRDQGMVGSADPTVARACLEESRALLSLDLGFADIRSFPPREHAGMIVLRPARTGPVHAGRLLDSIRERLGSRDLRGQLWIVGEAGVRIRGDPAP